MFKSSNEPKMWAIEKIMSLSQQFVSTPQKLRMVEIRRTCMTEDVHQSIYLTSTVKFTQIEKKVDAQSFDDFFKHMV